MKLTLVIFILHILALVIVLVLFIFHISLPTRQFRNCLIEKYKDNRYIVRAENSQWRGTMTGNFVTNISDNSQLAVAVNLMNQTSKDQIDFSGKKTAIYIKGSLVN